MNKLIHGDCVNVLKEIDNSSVNMVFADPPYYLSNGGVSYNSGKIVSVNKGDWDKYTSSNEIYAFNKLWLTECKRILTHNGSIFISGTHHNIFDIGVTLRELGYTIINLITWQKADPPPLIYKNKLRFSTEHIIWAKPNKKHYFNYNKMYEINKEELTDVWRMGAVEMWEKNHGKHPTQKPIKLLKRIILSSTKINDVVLDPFMGSGTTCLAAKDLNRRYIGIEKEEKYVKIAESRVNKKSKYR